MEEAVEAAATTVGVDTSGVFSLPSVVVLVVLLMPGGDPFIRQRSAVSQDTAFYLFLTLLAQCYVVRQQDYV